MSNIAEEPKPTLGVTSRPKDLRFWLILFSLCVSLFLAALELTAVSTALPTIIADLHGEDFVWVGSAYALASSAVIPMTGGLAQIFGRKPSFFGSVAFFAVGSAICGAAKNMNMLIAGRTVQGIGGGGIMSFTVIVIGDMVSLEERGLYAGGFFGLTWSVAAGIGPLVGGSLTTGGQWRWLFYLNLPVCGASAALAAFLVKSPTPPGTLRHKLSHMDWIGNFLVISASCATTIALTQGGINFSWQSARILSPLIIGLIGLGLFIIYEALLAKHPLVPFYVLSNRTSLSGYLQTFFLPVTSLAMIYYIPVYFQACKHVTPIKSGIDAFGLAAIAPATMLGGISVKVLKYYRPQIWIGWCLQVIGAGLMTTIKVDSSIAPTVGFCVIYGFGAGLNYGTQVFPIQAPLPITANALAFMSFLRSFAGVWGVTLGGAILQNELHRRLPPAFLSEFPEGVAIAYAVIPQIRDLPQPLQDNVRNAFAASLSLIWKVVAGVCGAGLLSTVLMKGLPLHTVTDETWAPEKNELSKRKGESAHVIPEST